MEGGAIRTESSSSSGSGQQEELQKLQLLFCIELTETDVSSSCSFPNEYVNIFLDKQDNKGHVNFHDLQSGEEWRIHLGISKTNDSKYNFSKGWLQFVQAKGLAVGDSVLFYNTTQVRPQFYINCIAQRRSLVGHMNTRTRNKAFNDMLNTIRCLSQTGHLTLLDKTSVISSTSNQELFSVAEVNSLSKLMKSGSESKATVKCVDCLLYLSIFPRNYEISGDTLFQLWIASGLVRDEDIGNAYLRALASKGYVSLSRNGNEAWSVQCSINGIAISKDMLTRISHLRVDGDGDLIVKNKQNKIVTVQNLPANNLEMLKQLRRMKMLWFLDSHESRINHVPYDFFISLRYLEILNLSQTKISELPSSVGNVKGLRYLDLSNTLIKQLPENIGFLQELLTLKLRNCPHLVKLPKNTMKLVSLQHLDLGRSCHLHMMPPNISQLTNLRTLSEFVASKQLMCTLVEVRNLNNLTGKLCLSKLENAGSALITNLKEKCFLTELHLQWSSRKQDDLYHQTLIRHLQPHTALQELRILYYGGSTFPNWISNPSFYNLRNITLFSCENCDYLPPLGRLPSLMSLQLNRLTSVKAIDFHFWRHEEPTCHDDTEDVAFPKLQNLSFISMHSLKEWKDVGRSHYTSLLKLTIKDCPKFEVLCSLSNICTLQHLEISSCPLLPSLPVGCLPASVDTLVIEDCPLLKSTCRKQDGQDRHKIEHVSSVWIDYKNITSFL